MESLKRKRNYGSSKERSPMLTRAKMIASIVEHPDQNESFKSKDTSKNNENRVPVKSLQSPKPSTSKNGFEIEKNPKRRLKKNVEVKSSVKQSNLNKSIKIKKKKTSKNFNRSESSDSCDLPIFKENKSIKTTIHPNFNEKYGMNLPTVEEILEYRRELEQYKNKVLSFKPLDDSVLESPFSIKSLNQTPVFNEEILDCKHLSLQDITEYFTKHLQYLSGIFKGEIYNERHQKYYDKTRQLMTLTTKDLTYNTSMIVFNYEQKEQMVNLLKKHLDPDDTKTEYFFQVLLPELCLQIFMDSQKMTREQAIIYLDKRPITENE